MSKTTLLSCLCEKALADKAISPGIAEPHEMASLSLAMTTERLLRFAHKDIAGEREQP
jgi:hypothetical protein